MKGDPLEKFFSKKSHNAEKTEIGDLSGFLNIMLSPSIRKIEGGPFEDFFEKSHNAEKTERGDLLVSPGTVCYAEKQEKSFWFSSLGQMVQFDTIIFRRNFVELFWSVRVD